MRWAGHVTPMEEKGSVYKDLVGKSEGRRPSWRSSHRFVDNIKMDITIYGVGV
jgi:hypothetical protein